MGRPEQEHCGISTLRIACVPELAIEYESVQPRRHPPIAVPLNGNRCAKRMSQPHVTSFNQEQLEEPLILAPVWSYIKTGVTRGHKTSELACAQHGAHASVVLVMPFDSSSDGNHDLPFLLVGFHVLVGINNAFQWERAVDDGFQRTGFDPVIDESFAASKPLGVPNNLKHGVTSHC